MRTFNNITSDKEYVQAPRLKVRKVAPVADAAAEGLATGPILAQLSQNEG